MRTLRSVVLALCMLIVTAHAITSYPLHKSSFTKKHLESLKNQTKELFDHGWNSYMACAFPADELKPLTCEKYERSPDVMDIHRNDMLGNHSVTFIDSLTTFAIMGDIAGFAKNIEVVKDIEFNADATVQVFETAIRTLGSLLSCHLYASDEFKLDSYDGFLLRKAKVLGDKLLSAYRGKNGLPLPRINLNGDKNLPSSLISETCTAGAASPMLELTLLSVLTNDTKYEEHSKSVFLQLWNSRSELDLLPMTFDPLKGIWLDSITGIGASIDSFYEYALKGSILFNDYELENIWTKSLKALNTHSKQRWFFTNVDTVSGATVSAWIDSLGAFFPGLLVLGGRVTDAVQAHQPFMKLWNKYGGIPERWEFLSKSGTRLSTKESDPVALEWYPLRPEFIESTYYLHRATRDPLYLRIGERVLEQFQHVFKVNCGFSGFHDVRNGERQNRMESFVLSETLMYLYLLFDTENSIDKRQDVVFSTEGHPLWTPKNSLSRYNKHKFRKHSSLENDVAEHTQFEMLVKQRRFSEVFGDFTTWNKEELKSILDYISDLFGNGHNISTSVAQVMQKAITLTSPKYGCLVSVEVSTCEVIEEDHFWSEILGDPSLFILDSKFKEQWTYSANNSIELDPRFYELNSLPDAYSYREPTVDIMDSIVGNSSHIRDEANVEYYLREGRKDFWIHSMDGLRLRLEILRPATVDSHNIFYSTNTIAEYLSYLDSRSDGTCRLINKDKLDAGVLKVVAINGLMVGPDAMVYVAESESNDIFLTENGIETTTNHLLVLHQLVVINLHYGEDF